MSRQIPQPRAGEVWEVALGPGRSPEQVGTRPALVVSIDWFNDLSHYLVITIPITGTDRNLPYQVRISGREGGLSKNSVIMCDQAKATSLMRFQEKRGEVSDQTLAEVRRMLGRILGTP